MREKLADLCHKQWSWWMEYLFSKSIPYKPGEIQADEGAVIVPKWAVDRWTRQMKTPYAELSEEEKESDREEADRFLALLFPNVEEAGAIAVKISEDVKPELTTQEQAFFVAGFQEAIKYRDTLLYL